MSNHLHSFGIENVRVFDEMTQFEFAPITFLVGPNSSGKSTLMKMLLLLRGSARSGFFPGTLSFSTDHHNLGHFRNILPRTGHDEFVAIEFPLVISHFSEEFRIRFEYESNGENGLMKRMTIMSKDIKVFDVGFSIGSKEEVCVISLDVDFFVTHIVRNDDLFKSELVEIGTLFPSDIEGYETRVEGLNELDFDVEASAQSSDPDDGKTNLKYGSVFELFDGFRSTIEGFPTTAIPKQFADEFEVFKFNQGDREGAHGVLCSLFSSGVVFSGNIRIENYKLHRYNVWHYINLTQDRKWFSSYLANQGYENVDYEGLTAFGEYLFDDVCKRSILKAIGRQENMFRRINRLSANRGSSDRLLVNSSIGSEINSLALEFYSKDFANKDHITLFVKDALLLFEVGSDIDISRIQGVVSQLYLRRDDNSRSLLTDLGFGIGQLVPIILRIAITAGENFNFGYYDPSVIMLEEPESNLHPNFQSKLADLFIMAGERFNIQFIIETHSEYLIRKMQYHIARGKIKPQDANIYYFHHPDRRVESEGAVRKIDFEQDGRLTREFGSGFFDEADNIAMDLFDLSNTGKN